MKTKGIALISTLIMVAIASTIMARILVDETFYLESTRKMVVNQQLSLYHLSLEDMAKVALLLDIKDNKVDHKNEIWNIPFSYPLNDNLVVSLKVDDLHRTLNINNLQNFNPKNDKKDRKTKNYYQAKIIAETLEINGFPDGMDLTCVLIDWIDKNNDAIQENCNGAESSTYLYFPVPYRAANGFLTHFSELNLLLNFNKVNNDFEMPFNVVADNFSIVSNSNIKINVNTIPCDSNILEILFDQPITQKKDDEEIDENAPKTGFTNEVCIEEVVVDFLSGEEFTGEFYESVDEFYSKISNELGTPPGGGDWKQEVPADLFTVVSEYFVMNASFFLDTCEYRFKSILFRKPSAKAMTDIKVISRELSYVSCDDD